MFSVIGVIIGLDKDLTVIVSAGIHWVYPDDVNVTVLQFLFSDVTLSRVDCAVWPIFTGRVLWDSKRYVGMWILLDTMSK